MSKILPKRVEKEKILGSKGFSHQGITKKQDQRSQKLTPREPKCDKTRGIQGIHNIATAQKLKLPLWARHYSRQPYYYYSTTLYYYYYSQLAGFEVLRLIEAKGLRFIQ